MMDKPNIDFRDERSQDGTPRPIDRRNGGCAALVRNKLYVWGGQTEDIIDDERQRRDLPRYRDKLSQSYPLLVHPFDVFDFSTRTWTRQPTSGTFPKHHGLGSSLVYDDNDDTLYLFGGWNRRQFDSDVYACSLEDFIWSKIELQSDVKPNPRYKTEVFLHKNKLCIFGGVSTNIDADPQTRAQRPRYDKGADWVVVAPDGAYGWSNEYFELDLQTKCWCTPIHEDVKCRPGPLAGHRMTKFDSKHAVLFGGKGPEPVCRTNEVWILNLDNKVWKGPLKQYSSNQSWPKECRFFTLTSLVDPDTIDPDLTDQPKQRLLLLWGKALYLDGATDIDEVCHRGTWLMEIECENVTWTEINIDETPRAWHVAAAYHPYSSSAYCEVVVTGGNKHVKGIEGPRNAVSDTIVLEYGVKPLQRLCVEVLSKIIGTTSQHLPPSLSLTVLNYSIACKEPVPLFKQTSINTFQCVLE